MAVSPDGSRIASGSVDNTLKVRSAATGQELLTLKGHTRSVISVAFSPDGLRIASGHTDGTMKVWSASSPKPDAGALFLTTHRLEAESWAKQQHAAGAMFHYAQGSWEWLVVSGLPWVR